MITQDHYVCFKLGVGLSKNTIFELISLWNILYCAKSMVLPTLHIHGDSTTIINWFNRRSTLTLLALDGWCQCIRDMEPYFIQLKSVHIFREHNTKAYRLYPKKHQPWPRAIFSLLNSLMENVLVRTLSIFSSP